MGQPQKAPGSAVRQHGPSASFQGRQAPLSRTSQQQGSPTHATNQHAILTRTDQEASPQTKAESMEKLRMRIIETELAVQLRQNPPLALLYWEALRTWFGHMIPIVGSYAAAEEAFYELAEEIQGRKKRLLNLPHNLGPGSDTLTRVEEMGPQAFHHWNLIKAFEDVRLILGDNDARLPDLGSELEVVRRGNFFPEDRDEFYAQLNEWFEEWRDEQEALVQTRGPCLGPMGLLQPVLVGPPMIMRPVFVPPTLVVSFPAVPYPPLYRRWNRWL